MKWHRGIQAKLLVSYLAVILLVVIVLPACQLVWPLLFPPGHPPPGGDLALFIDRLLHQSVLWGILLSLFVGIPLSAVLARRLIRPLREMNRTTRAIAEGEYRTRVAVRSNDEIGELAESLNRMAAGLERVEALRRELVANVAHEIRTPLTNLEGYLEAVLDGVFPADRVNIDRLRRQTARLHRLVDDLTQLAGVEALTTRLELQPATVRELVTDGVDPLGPRFAAAGVGLEVVVADGLPPVLADHDRVVQVLTNLLDNALRFTDRGGGVRIEAANGPSDVRITVADTGCGINPEDLPHIFERFFRSDRSRSRDTGGSGIGLAIVKAIVEAHGGTIAVTSQPSRGTRFEFALPIARADLPIVRQARSPEPVMGVEQNLRSG